jgi:hypothetical protein
MTYVVDAAVVAPLPVIVAGAPEPEPDPEPDAPAVLLNEGRETLTPCTLRQRARDSKRQRILTNVWQTFTAPWMPAWRSDAGQLFWAQSMFAWMYCELLQ